MSAPIELSRDERERLAEALHEGIDGDLLTGAGKGIGTLGNDVPLGEARNDEVVWWAVDRLAPVVAAIAEEREGAHVLELEAAIDRVRRRHAQTSDLGLAPGKWCPECGQEEPCATRRALRGKR
jgi:hypothetical protein